MNHNTFRSLAALGLGFLPGLARAHQMWIETLTDPPRTVVRFGEFGDSVEKSPGYLDQLAPLLAWLPAASGETGSAPSSGGAAATGMGDAAGGAEAKVLPCLKKEDHLLLEGSGHVPVALAQTAFPVMGKAGAPGRLPHFYLRWHEAGPDTAAAEQKPAMTLDLVPEGKNRIRVFFRAVPVAGAALTLRQADGKEMPLTANAEGRVTLPACPAGATLLTVNQAEDLPGIHLGKLYAITSHNASLSWVSR